MIDLLLQKKRYIVVIGILIATIPLICLFLFIKFNFIRDLERTSIQQRETYAVAATQILNKRIEAEVEFGNAFTSRQSLQQALIDGNQADMEYHLKILKEFSHSIERVYIASANGTMLATYPADNSIIGKDFSHRDWYQKTTRNWQPYVSDFFLRAVQPHRYIFTISLPIRSPDGKNSGILVMEPKDTFIRSSLDEIKTGGSSSIYVVDKKGTLIFHQLFEVNSVIDYSTVPVVRKVINGLNGAEKTFNPLAGQEEVAAYHPISRSGWGLVTVQPLQEILAPLKPVEKGLYLFIVTILLLAGFNAFKWATMLLNSRHLSGKLQKRSEDLAAANEALQKQSIELQAQAEELEIQSEEMQAQNEELQTQGEELEMQTEELLRQNEELEGMRNKLYLVNEHLELKVCERTAALSAEIDLHRRTEQQRRESEDRYRSLVENIHLGITLIDDKHSIIMTNTALGKIINKTADDLVHKFCYQEIEQQSSACPNCPGQIAMETGKPVSIETESLRDNGSRIAIRKTAFPVANDDGQMTSFIMVLQDITEQRQNDEEKKSLEQQLRQSQKMEVLGQLAGGVAHDFNNILTVIDGYGSMMLHGIPHDDPLKINIEHILAASGKAANLTRRLLAFSRKQVMNTFPVDMNVIIDNVVTFLRRILGEDIKLTVINKVDTLPILADSVMIEQVLINLAANARDAMHNGGTLTIEADLQQLDEAFVQIHGYATPPGLYTVIHVTDTGCGMDEETLKRVFDPFFTTKEVGKGTGLGLSMAYGIIKQHNGYINVYSEPENGTTFRIYLPAMEEKLEHMDTVIAQASPTGGTETILLAEDDPAVRSLMEKILSDYGYHVILAEDGEEAVKKFAANKGEIRLVLMDVIMPKKNGKDAANEILQLKPGTPILYASGYTADFIHNQTDLPEEVELIMKPVKPADLIVKIEKMLGEY
jgi:PAS domain S-box-containing protein